MKKIIDSKIEKYIDEIIDIRRDIHMHPELGMEEERTSNLVAKELEKLNLNVEKKVGKMGVVGLLEGNKEGKTLLLRADMDALPINEATNLDFKSVNEGVMHACGHDVHTSILLGTAKVLNEIKDEINGNIKFAFQPAEEMNPTGGSRYMIEDGVLENPKVDAAMGLHIWPKAVGQVALKPGVIMAQSDRIFIKVKGQASHASEPQNGQDAIVAAASIINGLQTIVSRNISPMESAVITIGTIHGGNRYNVLCDEVLLEGTVRIFNKDIADQIPGRIENIATNIANAMDCIAEVEYVPGYSMTVNDEDLTHLVIDSFNQSIGEENVNIVEHPAAGSEDFSEFAKRVPSVFYWLGIQSDINKGKTTLHNPNLLVDEDAIAVGIRTMCNAAIDFLNN